MSDHGCYHDYEKGSDYYRFQQEREAHDRTKKELAVLKEENERLKNKIESIKIIIHL